MAKQLRVLLQQPVDAMKTGFNSPPRKFGASPLVAKSSIVAPSIESRPDIFNRNNDLIHRPTTGGRGPPECYSCSRPIM